MDNKLKLDKSSKVILIFLVIYLIVMLVIFLPKYIKLRGEKLYLVTSSYQIKYEYGKWRLYDISSLNLGQTFEVYENDIDRGEYSIYFQDKIYFYEKDDDEYKSKRFDGTYLAYKGTLPLKVAECSAKTLSEEDNNVIELALDKINVKEKINFDVAGKYTINIDSDDELESIYYLNNFYNEESGTKISMIFLYNDGDVTIIDKTVTDKMGIYSEALFSISNILDIKNDGEYELIYLDNYYSKPEDLCVTLYNLNSKKEINKICKK